MFICNIPRSKPLQKFIAKDYGEQGTGRYREHQELQVPVENKNASRGDELWAHRKRALRLHLVIVQSKEQS